MVCFTACILTVLMFIILLFLPFSLVSYIIISFLGHRLGDVLIDLLNWVSVHPSVRPQEVFKISI